MEKYTHYLGPDSDPETAGPQGVCVDFTTWGAGFPSEFGTNYSSGRIVFTLPGNWSDVGCGAPTTPPTPSGEGCSDGARAAATVGGLALLLQVIATRAAAVAAQRQHRHEQRQHDDTRALCRTIATCHSFPRLLLLGGRASRSPLIAAT